MLLLQEHHITTDIVSYFEKILPGESHTYWEVSIGDHGRMGIDRGGSVCMQAGTAFSDHASILITEDPPASACPHRSCRILNRIFQMPNETRGAIVTCDWVDSEDVPYRLPVCWQS